MLKNGKLLLQKKNDFFKLFDQEAVLSVFYANPRSWRCKKVSRIDSTYSNLRQRLPPASVIDFRSVSGRKSAILLMSEWLRENSPDGLDTNPRLGNRRTHPNLSQITVVCNYIQYKSVWHDFFEKSKMSVFYYHFLQYFVLEPVRKY